MVDEHIIATLPQWESIIDAMLTCLGESVAAVHVILISWALLISVCEQLSAREHAMRDAQLGAAYARVTPQQLVSNSRNPRFIERGR